MLDTINKIAASFSTADLIIAAGIIATGLQYLINRYANLKKFTNQLLGFAIPGLVVTPALVVSLFDPIYAPVVYAISQLVYYVIERIKASVKPTVEPAQF
jgi:hypothetical protein